MQPASTQQKKGLTEIQSQALQALATGATMTAAAAAVNLHRTTLYHWIHTQPEFNTAVRDARTECYRTWQEQKQEAHALAWSTLRELLTNPETPPAVRLRAAIVVLKNGFDSPELSQPLLPVEFGKNVENVESPVSKTTAVPAAPDESAKPVENVELAKRTLPQTPPSHSEKHVESVESVEIHQRTQLARSSPCPCGSGEKFKRCCGRTAPPLLMQQPIPRPAGA
jgi:hypothetical protein